MGTAVVYGGVQDEHQKATSERLSLLCPNLDKADPADRVVILSLATKCQMHRQPKERRALIICLRGAAHTLLAEIPAGREGLPGPAALEVMLNELGE